VPGGITGPPCSWGYKYGDLALQVGVDLNLRQYNVVISRAGLEPKNDCAGEGQQQLNNRPIISSERMLHKEYNRKCGEKITGRESQGACPKTN
jgi:hypothetical protein